MKPRFVFCMKWGTRYGPEYVNRLYRGVAQNLPKPFRFICFTDNAEGLAPGVEAFPLPLDQIPGTDDLRWRKLGVFKKDLFGLQGRAIFMDLDTVAVGPMADLFEYDKPFAVLHELSLFPRPWYTTLRRRLFKPNRYRWAARECNTSVFAFDIGQCDFILDAYINNVQKIIRNYRREQEFVAREVARKGWLHYWPKSWCVSFKENCLVPGASGRHGHRHLPADARIVVCVEHMDMSWALANRERISATPGALQWLADTWKD